MIDACLQEAGIGYEQLSGIGLSQGPGSYSSLRTGAGVAKGLCFALAIPLIAVDTLQALAWEAAQQTPKNNVLFLAMLDARRDEVWLAAYNHDNQLIRPAEPLVIVDNNLNEYIESISTGKNKNIFFCGNATPKVQKVTPFEDTTFMFGETKCSAKNLGKIVYDKFCVGANENLDTFNPTYMKPPNITTSLKKII
jgi:tRNA threonylcarbamoyladenosine biosynthesis protein TsaB